MRKPKLTENQIKQLEKIKLPTDRHQLNHVRNTFLLQFYAYGSRISDALTWKKENIHQREDGLYLEYTARKTGNLHSVRLNRKAVALANHYLTSVPGSYLLPWMLRHSHRPAMAEAQNSVRIYKAISARTTFINRGLKLISQRMGLATSWASVLAVTTIVLA